MNFEKDKAYLQQNNGVIPLLLWNVRSINNKVDFIMQYIFDADISVACITESWLTEQNNHVTFRIKSYGYSLSHKPRENGKGGGVCFIFKSNINVIEQKRNIQFESFEYHAIEIRTPGKDSDIIVICIYRKQEISSTQFYLEITHFCETFIEQSLKSFIVVGDFNVHYESNNFMSNQLNSIMSTYGMDQHVESPTHKSGHMLDLVFSNPREIPLHSFRIDDIITENTYFKFDHFPIRFSAECFASQKTVEYTVKDVRNISAIDIDHFNETYIQPICDEILSNLSDCNFETTICHFNNSLLDALNEVAPSSRKRYKNNPNHFPVNWVDDEYRIAQNLRRKLERAHDKSPLDEQKKTLFIKQKVFCARLAKQKMVSALSSVINDRENKSDLFNILNGILDNKKLKCLPDNNNSDILSDRFNLFFLSKVENIRNSIPYSSQFSFYHTPQSECTPFNSFQCIAYDDLKLILKEMGRIKTSPIDPLPAKLLNKCIDTLLPALVEIINKSLREGTVEGLKHSIITPIYKKHNLDVNL